MTDWNYGDAGDRIPVELGEFWSVGSNVFLCDDLEDHAADRLLERAGQPAVIYTDPPYDKNAAAAFRTKAGMGRPVDFMALTRIILAACQKAGCPTFLEMGKRNVKAVSDLIVELGGITAKYPITYYKKNPAWLIQASWHGALEPLAMPDGTDDEDTPHYVIQQFSAPGQLVVDFCVGRGLTAVTAMKLNRRSAGVELHPRRLAVTLEKLEKTGHGYAERLGI